MSFLQPDMEVEQKARSEAQVENDERTGDGDTARAEMQCQVGSKLLCLIRHGQGKHNPRDNPLAVGFLTSMMKRDAPLTGKGKRQARAIADHMQTLPFELVVVSPLSRTIETATEVFGPSNSPPRVLCALMCERCMFPADQGTPLSELKSKHPQIVEWSGTSHLPERFWPKRSISTAAEQDVEERVELFKQWLLARPETCIAVVGHSAFFSTMTQRPKLGNCEAFWCELTPDSEINVCSPLPQPPGANAA